MYPKIRDIPVPLCLDQSWAMLIILEQSLINSGFSLDTLDTNYVATFCKDNDLRLNKTLFFFLGPARMNPRPNVLQSRAVFVYVHVDLVVLSLTAGLVEWCGPGNVTVL